MHQLNTKIGILEDKLANMSMSSSSKEDLDKEDKVREDLDKEDKGKRDKVKKDVGKEDMVKKGALPKSQIWSGYPRIQRRHTITNSSAKSKSGRKN